MAAPLRTGTIALISRPWAPWGTALEDSRDRAVHEALPATATVLCEYPPARLGSALTMSSGMQRYWDERAQEDPFYYVDSREALGAPNEEAFWAGGEEVVQTILGDLGVSLSGPRMWLRSAVGSVG